MGAPAEVDGGCSRSPQGQRASPTFKRPGPTSAGWEASHEPSYEASYAAQL
jgi:hypothetical protein